MVLALVAALAASSLAEAVEGLRTPSVTATVEETANGSLEVTGRAGSHEAVADHMRAIASLVETPRGIGRIIEKRRGRRSTRVELLGGSLVFDIRVRLSRV